MPIKRLLIHLLLATMLVIGLTSVAYYYLKSYTQQDRIVEVPELEGYDIVEAESVLKEISLQGVIVDSLYLPDKRPGEIVDQEPAPMSLVKENRKIYLTIARYSSPMVKLPNIIDQTLPLALAKLSSYGIEVGTISNKPSDCTDCVIGVELGGSKIEPGTSLNKGQKIDLVVGVGETGERINIPVFYGLSVEEASLLAHHQGINIGATPYINCETKADSIAARIYKQSPEPHAANRISRGASVDVYLTSDLSLVPTVNLDSIRDIIRQ